MAAEASLAFKEVVLLFLIEWERVSGQAEDVVEEGIGFLPTGGVALGTTGFTMAGPFDELAAEWAGTECFRSWAEKGGGGGKATKCDRFDTLDMMEEMDDMEEIEAKDSREEERGRFDWIEWVGKINDSVY